MPNSIAKCAHPRFAIPIPASLGYNRADEDRIDTALQRNREFQEYGVRQLARLIQDLTTPSIEAARKSGALRVRLDLDRATGRVLVTEAK